MAIWQFDCYIIPKKNVTANIGLESDEIFIWGKQTAAIEKIDFLEKQKSWSPKISQYGKSDETCIEFFYEKAILIEIYCRLDLRSLSKKILEKILGYAQEIDGMIFYENKIYTPKIDEIVEVLKKSNANKFCQNPPHFFEEMYHKSNKPSAF